MNLSDEQPGVVYYARTCCRVKIGYTTNLARTMMELSPDELLTTEPGTRETELKRHRQFEGDRARGDWYDGTPTIMAHVRAVRIRHHSADTDNPGERLIPTASAMAWTGRDRQVLYRWAAEGRITRYGTPREALWDILELPAKGADGVGAPPPKRS